jgi:hypothetical protein
MTTTALTYTMIERSYDKLVSNYQNTGAVKNDIAYFQANIGKVKTVDDLLNNYRLYSFVMKAFNMEDKIPAKALVKKMLTGDITDKSSLIYRTTDPNIKNLYNALGMKNGQVTKNGSATWVANMVKQYATVGFENAQGDSDPAVQEALYFKRNIASVNSWYGVMADPTLYDVVKTALNLPDSMSSMDVTKQATLLQSKYDFKKFQSSTEVEKFVQRYVSFSDAQSQMNNAQNSPLLQLFQPAQLTGNSFIPVTIDITSIPQGSLKYFSQ